jgi:hypothetical protein
MRREKDLKRYGKVVSEHLSKYLKDRFKVSYDIYPSNGLGALLVFNISTSQMKDSYKSPSKNVSESLASIEQNFIEGDLKNINFGGTNLFMDNHRVIIIKGDDAQNTWSKKAAIEDVKKIVKPEIGE